MNAGFCGGRKTGEPGEKPLKQGRESATNSTHIWHRVRESNPGLQRCTLQTSSILCIMYMHTIVMIPHGFYMYQIKLTLLAVLAVSTGLFCPLCTVAPEMKINCTFVYRL
jgi:hypothetical protein